MMGAWHVHRLSGRLVFVLLGGLLPIVSMIVQAFGHLDVEREALADYPMLGFVQAVLFGFTGYWLAKDKKEVGWLLRNLALCCAVGSTLGAFARAASLEDYPFLVPSFPVRLIFLFGHCWYLRQWLALRQWRLGSLMGLVACAPEVWISFHKPIVFSASVASLFLIGYSIWITKRPIIVLCRMAVLVVLAAVSIWVANAFTSGRVAQEVEEIVYTKFLKQDVGKQISLDDETLLKKASGGRLDLWEKALAQIGQNPLFGSGFDVAFVTENEGENIYVHNWYLELLLSVGCVGALPVFAALLWWLRLVTRRRVINQAGSLVMPCLACIVGLMAYNLGGSIRIFFSMTSFAVLLMAVCTRLADQSLAAASAACARPRFPQDVDFRSGTSEFGKTGAQTVVARQRRLRS